MMFAAGVLVGIPCGVALTLYLICAVPRVLGKIFQTSPER
jgi:hypothetical protein